MGTKGAAIQDYNLPGNTVIAPIKIDSGWGFGHWQSWADADNIATTTSNAGNAFTNLGIMQPSLYLNYVVKVYARLHVVVIITAAGIPGVCWISPFYARSLLAVDAPVLCSRAV